MERQELEELRDFAGEMEQVLENVDFLLQIMDDDAEVPICTDAFWRPEYFECGWKGSGDRYTTMKPQPHAWMVQPVSMPAPTAEWHAVHTVDHMAVQLSCDTLISDRDIMLRRSPGEMASLVARVGEDIQRKLQAFLMQAAHDPVHRAKLLRHQ